MGPHAPKPYAKHVASGETEWWELACEEPECRSGIGPFDTPSDALAQSDRMVALCADDEDD